MLPLIAGHYKGAERIEPLVEYAAKIGIRYVTFWAFSSENWNRGDKEVGFLMRVFRDYIKGSVVKRMMKKGVRVNIIGDLEAFPADIVKDVKDIVEKSKGNEKITATFALNYGGREEIIAAVNKMIDTILAERRDSGSVKVKIKDQKSKIKNSKENLLVNEEVFPSYLYTRGLPEPDMIVRTGGEKRLSGFMPWQAVYSELYFTDVFWPDFDEKEFGKAIEEYMRRERRYGK